MQLPRTNSFFAVLGFLATALPSLSYNADWTLIFNDEFAASSFTDGVLNWDEKWNKTEYLNTTVPDWRKYQSRDDALVTQGISGSTDYVSLKGAYGDYTSQSDQTGAADTFACGGLFTYTTFSFQYGYVEARARFDSAQGAWPAIWLMPVPANSKGWLASGEIDIMEHINYESRVHQTLHLYNDAGTADAAPTRVTGISDVNGWHTYGVEWNPDSIAFYIDGVRTASFSADNYANWPFADENCEFYLLIDQQLGGNWTGAPNAEALRADSADLDIDYVRVYSTKGKDSAAAPGAASWDAEQATPIDREGNLIDYTDTPAPASGILDQSTTGNYHFQINSEITHALAEGSHLQLSTTEGSTTVSMNNSMIQANSLYLSEGKYLLGGSATLDVDTLFVVGGSLEIDSPYALSGIRNLYLGMETDAITNFAARNAALYFTENHHIAANTTLVDDSKIAVFQGKTLEISGNIQAESHTLNLVGVNSAGTATIILSGSENKLSTLTLGVSETTSQGNTFNGAGQILELQLATGSNTEVDHLKTASPVAISSSSLTIKQGATLAVTQSWTEPGTTTFHTSIEQGGELRLGNTTHPNTITLQNSLTNDGTILARGGRIEFEGGLNGNGSLLIANNATVATQQAGHNTIHLEEYSTLETQSNFSGGAFTGSGTIRKTDEGQAQVSTDNTFSGSVEATAGSIAITGANILNTVAATGGELTFLNVTEGITVHTLRIYEGSNVGVFSSDSAESILHVSHSLTAGNGTLYADLVLADGAMLNITNASGLNMGSSITLSGKATLGDNIISAFAQEGVQSFTLASGMDGFYTDGSTISWIDGQSASAADYFTSSSLDLNHYTLTYEWEHPNDAGSGLLRLTRTIPEPSVGVLSLFGLGILLRRRARM